MKETEGHIEVKIAVEEGVRLAGDLHRPPHAQGIVIFAHGSGSSRFSVRNRQVAQMLHEAGLATLLMDLLTEKEEAIDQFTRALRFDMDLLQRRVRGAVKWVATDAATRDLKIGCFGASTGAAGALMAAAADPERVAAVVSRGGRPDLAADALPNVKAPTLFLVGGADPQVLALNRAAASRLTVEHRVDVIPGATHLFEEPGKLEEVARLTADWFLQYLP